MSCLTMLAHNICRGLRIFRHVIQVAGASLWHPVYIWYILLAAQMCKYRQAKLRCLLLALWRLRRSWRGSGLCKFPNFSETTQILEFDLFSSFSGMDILFYGSSIQLPLFCKVLKDWYFVVCFPDFCIFFPLIAVFSIVFALLSLLFYPHD